MALTGTRKAALLLASLDPGTAAELLKAARPDVLTEITAELVYLNASGARPDATGSHVQEFFGLLHKRQAPEDSQGSFVQQMLESAVGKQRGDELLGQARRLADLKDPFMALRSVATEDIAQALTGEHPQVAALMLIELPPNKSAALIPMLEEKVRAEAVRRMTCGDTVSPEARVRVAAMVRSRLEAIRKAAAAEDSAGPAVATATASPAQRRKADLRLRQVALLLRGLATELRDSLVKAIGEQSHDTSTAVQNMMVLWDDLPVIGDRSLQEVLRNVDARKLALALVGADAVTTAKIRNNISERARAMIDEETQLMKKPKAEEIGQARDAILGYLRQLNSTGELQFDGV